MGKPPGDQWEYKICPDSLLGCCKQISQLVRGQRSPALETDMIGSVNPADRHDLN